MKRVVVVSCLFLSLAVRLLAATNNAVTVHNTSSQPETEEPLSVSRVFARGEIPHFAQAIVNGVPGQTQCDVKTRWPDGSVQFAIVSFLVSIPARHSAPVSFADQPGGNNEGATDRKAMLAQGWTSRIEVTNGTTIEADARKMLNSWTGQNKDLARYWLKGPVCTQIILEDRSPALAYDMGWDSHKPLHPIFVLTFYPAKSGAWRIDAILENMWTGSLEDQTYSVTVHAGASSSPAVWTKPKFTHYARTRWRKTFWTGIDPAKNNIDYNLAYLSYSGAIPNFDLTRKVPRQAIAADLDRFHSGDKGEVNGSAFWTKYMPQTGGREDIGLFPAWDLRYLYSFDHGERAVFLGNSEVSGYVPIHLRESDPKALYLPGNAASGFARPFSLDAHPADFPRPVGPIAETHGWTVQNAHHGSFVYLSYLLSGDWYYLDELYQWAAWILSVGDPTDKYFGRHGAWGIVPYAGETRGVAWGLRDIAEAAFLSPDGSPEKAYFREKLNNNIAIREGEQDVKDGAFYDRSPGSKWHWGRYVAGEGMRNPLHFLNRGDEYASLDEMDTSESSPARVKWPDGPWQYNYFHIVFGHIAELGFPVRALQRVYLTNLLHQVLDPAYNPYLSGAYRIPVRQSSSNGFFQTWAEVKAGYSQAERKPWTSGRAFDMRTVSAWPENDENDFDHGYPHIVKAAASFLPGIVDGSLDGNDAWIWVSEHVRKDPDSRDLRWALVPRNSSISRSGAAKQ